MKTMDYKGYVVGYQKSDFGHTVVLKDGNIMLDNFIVENDNFSIDKHFDKLDKKINEYEVRTKSINELNKKLKEIITYEEFVELYKEVSQKGFQLVGKRRGYEAYSFTHLYEAKQINGEPYWFTGNDSYKNKLSYLYADSVSTGESFVQNIHRALEVRP